MEMFVDDEEKRKPSGVELKESTWEKLDRIAELETEKRRRAGKKGKVSRNRAIQELLDFAISEYFRREQPSGKKPSK